MKTIETNNALENTILVLGNGFDIANGYATKYSDFLEFAKSIYEKKNFSNGEEARYKELIQNNYFIKHFIDYKYKLDSWVDVENEMHNVVKAIEHVFNSEERNFKQVDLLPLTAAININTYEKHVLKEFCFTNNSNPNSHQIVSERFYSNEYGIVWEEVNKELENQLVGLKRALIIYLKRFMKREKKRSSIDCIKGLKPNHIITFNYTDTYKEYYKCEDVNHVHGDLVNENIVLGFEDDNPKELRYVKFKKYFQRIQNHLKPIDEKIFKEKNLFLEGLFEDSPEEALMSNIVHVYGASLSKGDEDLIKKIYNNADVFLVYYIDQKDYEAKIINLISIFGKDRILKDQYNGKLILEKIE